MILLSDIWDESLQQVLVPMEALQKHFDEALALTVDQIIKGYLARGTDHLISRTWALTYRIDSSRVCHVWMVK